MYSGIELLQAIKDGKIQNDTEFESINEYFRGGVTYEHGNLYHGSGKVVSIAALLDDNFKMTVKNQHWKR